MAMTLRNLGVEERSGVCLKLLKIWIQVLVEDKLLEEGRKEDESFALLTDFGVRVLNVDREEAIEAL